MSHHRICSFKCSLVGLIAIILYFVDRTLAQLESYVPDEDYPIYTEVPLGLSFTCDDKIPGYYADPEARCQVWHWCVPGIGGNEKYSFICAPGTVFNQRTRVCDYFYKVDCPNAPAFYGINEDLYKDEAGNYINGKKIIYDQRRLWSKVNRHNFHKAPIDKKRLIDEKRLTDENVPTGGKRLTTEKRHTERPITEKRLHDEKRPTDTSISDEDLFSKNVSKAKIHKFNGKNIPIYRTIRKTKKQKIASKNNSLAKSVIPLPIKKLIDHFANKTSHNEIKPIEQSVSLGKNSQLD